MSEPYSHLTGKKKEQAIDADYRCNKWLADGNEAAEQGNHAKAEKCYEKSQYWLDRFNKLCGRD